MSSQEVSYSYSAQTISKRNKILLETKRAGNPQSVTSQNYDNLFYIFINWPYFVPLIFLRFITYIFRIKPENLQQKKILVHISKNSNAIQQNGKRKFESLFEYGLRAAIRCGIGFHAPQIQSQRGNLKAVWC